MSMRAYALRRAAGPRGLRNVFPLVNSSVVGTVGLSLMRTSSVAGKRKGRGSFSVPTNFLSHGAREGAHERARPTVVTLVVPIPVQAAAGKSVIPPECLPLELIAEVVIRC